MERTIELMSALEQVKQDVATYRGLFENAEKRQREIEAELNASYCPDRCSTDLAEVKRNILRVMKRFDNRLWSLGEVADELPQYDYQLLSRQLQVLNRRGSVNWNRRKGGASRYSVAR